MMELACNECGFEAGVAASIAAAAILWGTAFVARLGTFYIGGFVGPYTRLHSRRGWKVVSRVDGIEVTQKLIVTLQFRGYVWGTFEAGEPHEIVRYSFSARFHEPDKLVYQYRSIRLFRPGRGSDYGCGVAEFDDHGVGHGHSIGRGPAIRGVAAGTTIAAFEMEKIP